MKVSELMRHEVRTCTPNATLDHVARMMWEADVGCVPVIDQEKRPIAVITDRDICMAAYTRGVPLHAIKASDAMSHGVITCHPEDTTREVEQIMQHSQVRRLPVVDGQRTLVGIITLADLARDAQTMRMPIAAPGLAKTLAAITERRWHGTLAAE